MAKACCVQGTSVTDLDDRVKDLERKMAEDMQALWPLRVRRWRLPTLGSTTGAVRSCRDLAAAPRRKWMCMASSQPPGPRSTSLPSRLRCWGGTKRCAAQAARQSAQLTAPAPSD